MMAVKDTLQSKLIFKYSFSNPLFLEHELLLNWSFSDTVLITAYDLLKNDFLVYHLSHTGSTLKEHLHTIGFNKNVKILADTGIFEFEPIKAHLDIAVYESVPHEFSLQDIFFAYELIDPDYIISPDDIILQSDSHQTAQNKVQSMINLFFSTLEVFGSSKQQIIPVIQGYDRDTVAPLLQRNSDEHITKIARGGLILSVFFNYKPMSNDKRLCIRQYLNYHLRSYIMSNP